MKKLCYLIIGLLISVACQNKPAKEKHNNDEQKSLENFEANYDESNVPNYELPPLLLDENGNEISSSSEWLKERRPTIYQKFAENVYGQMPGMSDTLIFVTTKEKKDALYGKARLKELTVYFTSDKDPKYSMDILIYMPKEAKNPSPAFVALNFYGNQSISDDTSITISDTWMRANDEYGIVNNLATEKTRGVRKSRWPVAKIIDAGFSLATIYCGDLDPDRENWQDGIHPIFYREGQNKPDSNQMATIGAWSWGLCRAMDYFEKDEEIDASKVAVMGHSRLGKAALWAGASDSRFKVIISNNSGCGGAALSRRKFGETIWRINNAFPHWFCENFNSYNDNEEALPIDQHMLIALIAPRAVYVASASEDSWADPKGEFLSAKLATPVYQLFGLSGLAAEDMPEINSPIQSGSIGYHIREGKHDVTDFDWQQYIYFAKQHL